MFHPHKRAQYKVQGEKWRLQAYAVQFFMENQCRDELLILPAKVTSDYDPVAAAAEAADERPVYCRNGSTANGRLNPSLNEGTKTWSLQFSDTFKFCDLY